MKKPSRWIAWLGCVVAGTALMLRVSAEAPDTRSRFEGDLLILPVVISGNTQYRMELQRQARAVRTTDQGGAGASLDGAVFEVLQSTKIAMGDAVAPAVLKNDILRIPVIKWGEFDYRIELRSEDGDQYEVFHFTALNAPSRGFAALPDGRGGYNFEAALRTPDAGFDMARSRKAFAETLYPFLSSSECSSCHNTTGKAGAAGQAPIHADDNLDLAHQYALTRVNFADPPNSKLVVRMSIDRHHCPKPNCAAAANDIETAIEDWKDLIADMLPETPRLVAEKVKLKDAEVEQWIADDRARLPAADRDFIVYTSMHELHNEGLSADELNIVRVALSKALNSVARWAPAVVNPVDVNERGLLYKFDMRDYWGWNKGVKKLLFGGSDDDLAFGRNKRDYRGNVVTSAVQRERYNYSRKVSEDPQFAKVIWERVLHGNVEGAVTVGTIPSYIKGFRGKRSKNEAGEFVAPLDFQWVETAQLIYTLTRPDVYNAIMMLPMYSDQLEDELGVDRSEGMDSYDYVVMFDAITVDSRMLWRARTRDGGLYWKTWDIFTGQLSRGDRNIFDIYRENGNDIRFPFWANPIPVFVDSYADRRDNQKWSFVATLAQPSGGNFPKGCEPQQNFSGLAGFANCKHFTGTGGGQQSASEIIWNLPNGLQGYMLTGAFNQRRVDAFVNIVRDPRAIPTAQDNIATQTGFAFGKRGGIGGFNDPRLNTGSSCIGCHIDGLNRINNNLRDWLDEGSARLPRGPRGVDVWINNKKTVDRVRELYPPSSVIRPYVEQGRQTFLGAMAGIKQGMMLGPDKNVYVEPVIWTVEYVQRKKYRYPQTTSN
jgi:hypothetical protein